MCDVKAVCHPRGRPPRVESNLVRAAVERARPAIAAVYFGNRGGRKKKKQKKAGFDLAGRIHVSMETMSILRAPGI